ncbi:MAG TPA: glycosyltransferase [Chloroflexota bacterium]|nr:glycosyltransferase [Chloroflexota bacterium]
MRLLMYSQDGMGLGHLRRSRNIAQEVLAREPDANVLILSDAPEAPFFSPLRGLDYLKLPTIVKTGSTAWRNGSLSLAVQETVALRAQVMLQVYHQFRPDAVLVDHMPVGALGELKPLLESAGPGQVRPRFFLGLRDILDAPEVIRQVWTGLGAYDYLPLYEEVFIYGCRDIYDADLAYRLSPPARQVTYCDYVASRSQAAPPEEESGDPFILVTGGGGHDAFPLLKAFLEALPLLWQHARVRAVVLTGPNMPAADRAALAARSGSAPVQLLASGDTRALLRRASAVVTMAGYNTICELLQARKKALVVPRAGPSAEQRMRSQLLAQRGLARVVDPDALTPDRLALELMRLLLDEAIPDVRHIPAMDGAARAAARITGVDTAPAPDLTAFALTARE